MKTEIDSKSTPSNLLINSEVNIASIELGDVFVWVNQPIIKHYILIDVHLMLFQIQMSGCLYSQLCMMLTLCTVNYMLMIQICLTD